MTQTVFWDVDTQVDFMMPDGALYISGAETILPLLERLTRFARERGARMLGSVDWHAPNDPEISSNPDFQDTFPPHCLAGTPGAEKVPATAPRNPLWIPNEPQDPAELARQIRAHDGEILLRKRRFDVFTNPNLTTLLETVKPERIVLYGVALDVCDAHAIEGFLKRGGIQVRLVRDATRAIDPARGARLVDDWKRRGVEILDTDDILAGA